MKSRISNLTLILIATTFFSSCKFLKNQKENQQSSGKKFQEETNSPYDNFPSSKFSRSLYEKQVIPAGGTIPISYGLEYEGGSPKIWEYFGQDSKHFYEHTHLWTCRQSETMIDWLMTELVTKNRAIREIIQDGKKILLSKSALPVDYSVSLPVETKWDIFEDYIANSFDSPMSFMPWEMRYQWINQWPLKQVFLEEKKKEADTCGKASQLKRKNFMQKPYKDYVGLVLLLGLDAAHIDLVKSEIKGWEINTKPAFSQQQFEEQLSWFEKHFGSVSNQHKRIVIPCGTRCDSKNEYKNFVFLSSYLQVLLFLVELEKKSEIISAPRTGLNAFTDDFFWTISNVKNPVVGAQTAITSRANEFKNVLPETHFSAEIRAGLEREDQRNFIFGYFQKWSLAPGHSDLSTEGALKVFKSVFGADLPTLRSSALSNVRLSEKAYDDLQSSFCKSLNLKCYMDAQGRYDHGFDHMFPMFWGWQNLPSANKHLAKINEESLKFVDIFLDKNGNGKIVDKETAKQALADWVKNTNVSSILAEYIWEK
jgi:hypothetical protein